MGKSGWMERVRQVRLVVKRAVATLHAGELQSIFKGAGLAFEEVRHYQPGDDVRNIDWNVTARMGQPYIKRFVEERELRLYFVLDLSGSQSVGSNHIHKRDIAAEVVALLCLAGLRQGDCQGLITFTNQVEKYLPPRRGLRHVLRLIYESLYADPDQRGTDLRKALRFTDKIARRRSVVIVLSDFLDLHWQTSLEKLAHRHDVYAIKTTAPLDRHLPTGGILSLRDIETEQMQFIDASAVEKPNQVITIEHQRRDLHWIKLDTEGKYLEHLLISLRQLRKRRGTAH